MIHTAVMQSSRRPSRGFTLIEMAVVVVVMALILGSILVPLSTQVEQRQVVDTQRLLEDIKEALIGYALTQATPHLPCPDKTTSAGLGTANDGVEDRDPGTGLCVSVEGNVPWATLGLGATDPWSNRYRYRVTQAFAQRAPAATFGLATQGDIFVCRACPLPLGCLTTPPPPPCPETLTVVPPSDNSPVALVLSHGPNGWGAINGSTSAINTKPPSETALGFDESANANGDATFVSRARVTDDGSNPSPEFDDIVVWLSPHTLKNRVVAAGKLP
jgi:prepilin-type N-terminal cleavage/methylation domain-containing protein